MKKEYKTLLIFSGIIIAFLVLFFAAMPRNSSEPSVSDKGTAAIGVSSGPSGLVVERSEFDFGTISMAKGKVSTLFGVKNTSGKPLEITRLYTSCMCTTASLVFSHGTDLDKGKKIGPFGMLGHGFVPSVNETIGIGEEFDVEVTFDPAAHGPAGVGSIERVVYLEQKGRSPLELVIRANVTP